MARGLGLRSRLINGRGGGGGGDLSLWMNLGQQLAQAVGPEDPDVAQARQLQGLKIQAAQQTLQAKLQAQQQEQETMAGFRKLGEDVVPEEGTEVPTEAQGPGAGQVLGTFAGQPTQNDRLLRAMIQSGNPQLLAKAQAQFAPQEPGPQGTVEEIGGQKFTRDVSGNLHPIPTKEPKETSLNDNELFAYVASGGAIKGHTIPEGMTVQQAKATIAEKQRLAQQRISIQQQTLQDKPAPKGTYVTANGDVNPVFSMSDAHQHINSGGIFLAQGSPSEKVKTGSDLFDTHINGALDMYEASPNANKGGRVTSYLKNSWQVYANDPAKVALFQFYGAATPFATSSIYNSMTNGRGSALMAQMLDPTGIEKGDNDATGLNKLYVGESLAREAAIKRGIPTAPYDKTLNRIQGIAKRRNVPLLQQFGTGGQRSVTLKGQTYTRD